MVYRCFKKGIIFLLIALSFFWNKAWAFNDKKSFEAVRVTESPKIDGKLDDQAWVDVPVTTDFTQYSPYNGDSASFKTEIKVLYDQTAIYIGAMMYDPNPDSILRELGERDADRSLNADHFSFDLNPFNDGVYGMTFKVSASGVKTDKKKIGSGRHGIDESWDVVWQSAVDINPHGWSAEIKIPYSAIRFPKTPEQVWGVNFWREIRRKREWSAWNYVNNEVGDPFTYLGEMKGIESIDPPLRLSVTPYLSGYLEKYSENNSWGTSFNGGMDLKYGINESFTLDMTLIPDFGQIQSDDVILNLSPFEVRYHEKRPFFTEGTELFNKGNIFYSRRVGSKPRGFDKPEDDLQEQEEVIENPVESKLINATKVSGRTNKGLGIGFFNAMTGKMHAIIQNTESGEKRKYLTQPFTNYNMLVFDQSLKNNSYVSLANTNVWRNAYKDELFYTANVTATDFNIFDKSNIYSVRGQAALSQKYYDSLDTDLGYRLFLEMGKTGGVIRAEYQTEIISDSYDPNDMGFERNRNEMTHQGTFSYNIFKPVGIIQNSQNSLEIQYRGQYKPFKFSELELVLDSFTSFMNFWYTHVDFEYTPLGTHDFYEPRVDGRSYYRYPTLTFSNFISSDRRKKIYGRIRFEVARTFSPYDQKAFEIGIEPTFRLSNRLQFTFDTRYSKMINDIGYVNINSAEDSIYFGMRDNITLSNTIESSFIFTNRSYLTFRLRHYWSRADYQDKYYLLQEDGYLNPVSYSENHDINFNIFNIDMVYVWRFAPGSEMSIVWKNSIYSEQSEIVNDYFDNLKNTFNSPVVNSLSLKILYYLDYQYLKRRS